jgi:hypothetical protein
MYVWIIGRKATLQSNGHEYMAEPYIVFEAEIDADLACDMIEKISGERPIKTSSALYRVGETARPTT